ncbi:hypothetical protein [Pseudomonas sp. 2FE]|uniref:hypothetical protein n=1 Tax=Pseudomonas sp. 2FE TaxID=2502190 RepID=UPI0010F6ED50|nr:hypothetical protein [Pseudomonas sp. 2FE]
MSTRLALPNTLKGWAREALQALDEAEAIRLESPQLEAESLFKLAPAIAAIYRGIEDPLLKESMLKHACGTVFMIQEHIPGYSALYKRCFVHCYLDTMILIKAMKLGKAEQVIDYLETKGKVEAWQV